MKKLFIFGLLICAFLGGVTLGCDLKPWTDQLLRIGTTIHAVRETWDKRTTPLAENIFLASQRHPL